MGSAGERTVRALAEHSAAQHGANGGPLFADPSGKPYGDRLSGLIMRRLAAAGFPGVTSRTCRALFVMAARDARVSDEEAAALAWLMGNSPRAWSAYDKDLGGRTVNTATAALAKVVSHLRGKSPDDDAATSSHSPPSPKAGGATAAAASANEVAIPKAVSSSLLAAGWDENRSCLAGTPSSVLPPPGRRGTAAAAQQASTALPPQPRKPAPTPKSPQVAVVAATVVAPWGDAFRAIGEAVEAGRAAAKARAKEERRRKRMRRGGADGRDDGGYEGGGAAASDDDNNSGEEEGLPPPRGPPVRRGAPEEWANRRRPYLTPEQFDGCSNHLLRALIPEMYTNTKGNVECMSSNRKWLRHKLVGN